MAEVWEGKDTQGKGKAKPSMGVALLRKSHLCLYKNHMNLAASEVSQGLLRSLFFFSVNKSEMVPGVPPARTTADKEEP